MKIRNEQINALQESEARRKSQAPAEGFAALLGDELGKASATPPAKADRITQPGQTFSAEAAAAGLDAAQASSALSETAALAADQVENLFSSLESYGNALAGGNEDSLKEAYGLLEQTAGQLNAFRAAFPDLGTQQPELAGMVNELEVLTTAEMFKFNRGDYL